MTQTGDTRFGDPPTDGQGRWSDEDEEDIAIEQRNLRIMAEAKRRYAEESNGGVPEFDAALLNEVLARPPDPPFRIHEVMPSDGALNLVAQRKTGKTTLELNLARSLLTAEPFLGRYSVIPVEGRVGILNYEVSPATLARWARDIGVPADRLLMVNLRGQRNPLLTVQDRRWLSEVLRGNSVEALIVDPFAAAYTGASQNDPGEVRAWLDQLFAYARTDCGVRDLVMGVHAGWNAERTRGASALEDWADATITVTMDDKGQRYLRALGRDVVIEEDRLDYDAASRLLTMSGEGGRRRSKSNTTRENLEHRLRQYITDKPGATFNDIDKAVPGRQQTKREIINEASTEGGWLTVETESGSTHRHFVRGRPES